MTFSALIRSIYYLTGKFLRVEKYALIGGEEPILHNDFNPNTPPLQSK